MAGEDGTILTDAGEVDAVNADIDAAIDKALDDHYGEGTVGDLIDTTGESTEAPSGEEGTPSEEAQSTESQEAQPRDDQGRFASPDAAQSEDETPAGEEESTEEGTEQEAEEEFPEFSFRADGQAFSIPGSAEDEAGGVYIPPESAGDFRQLLAAGKTHQGSFRKHMGEAATRVKEAEARTAAVKASKATLLQGLDNLLSLPEDTFFEKLEEFRARWPELKRQAEVEERDHLLKIEQGKNRRAQARERMATIKPKLIDKVEEMILEEGDRAGLSESVMKALFKRMTTDENLPRIFKARNGRLTTDVEYLRNEITFLRNVGATGEKTEAERHNEAKLTQKRTTKPKVPSPKGSTPVKRSAKKKLFSGIKTPEDADAFLMEGGYNKIFE